MYSQTSYCQTREMCVSFILCKKFIQPIIIKFLIKNKISNQHLFNFFFQKLEEIRATISADNTRASLPVANLRQYKITPKRRKIFTNKVIIPKKEVQREYLKMKTVNINLEQIETAKFTCQPKTTILPNLHKNIQQTIPSRSVKQKNFSIGNETENPISKISVNEDEYRLTINEGGHLENINVSLSPTMNNTRNYYNESYEYIQTPHKPNDETDLEKLIVVTTISGTSFEMKQAKTGIVNDIYKKSQTIKKLFPIVTRKRKII